MRWQSIVVVTLCFSVLLVGRVIGDDLQINTPVVSANLRGNWELTPKEAGQYRQTLHLGPQFTGEWRQSQGTLPVSIAWFVEGGELRILHDGEPAGAFYYRVRTLMVTYKLADDTLTLTLDGTASTWQPIRSAPRGS